MSTPNQTPSEQDKEIARVVQGFVSGRPCIELPTGERFALSDYEDAESVAASINAAAITKSKAGEQAKTERWTVKVTGGGIMATGIMATTYHLQASAGETLFASTNPSLKHKMERIADAHNATLTGEQGQRAKLTEKKLRNAWEHGIKIARCYGDNICHLQGEQKETQWRKFLKDSGFVTGEQAKDTEQTQDLGK